MATTKKLMGTTAVGGAAAFTAIEDVFSTYLYTGNGSTQTITNGIDLAGEGGLVWMKDRTSASLGFHVIYNTENGTGPNGGRFFGGTASTNGTSTASDGLQSFNSDGFTLGSNTYENGSGKSYASWTFRKAPRFFDVVTYTGDGTAGRTVSHNLGSVPGTIIIKILSGGPFSGVGNWGVYHRSEPSKFGFLNLNNAFNSSGAENYFGNGTTTVTPTSTEFTLGTNSTVNASGASYVAYLFAHDPLGPSGDGSDGLIACGSFTGSYSGATVNLGWEPQWILFKDASTTKDWYVFDSMRGIVTGGLSGDGDAALFPNLSNAENVNTWGIDLNATGFTLYGNNVVTGGNTGIYIAIRRGPMRQPTSGTEVFAIDQDVASGSLFQSGFPVDMSIWTRRATSASNWVNTRLLGSSDLRTELSDAETSFAWMKFDHNDGVESSFGTPNIAWMFRRAPGFFDVVAYTGDGVAGRTVPHNLGVAPEMMIVKRRNSVTDWAVYTASTGNDKILKLNTTDAALSPYNWWEYTTPTESVFTLGTVLNNGSGTYIAYLFATLPGVSKVGSISHSGTTNVDCGFTSGARFVLLKRVDSPGNWFVWDTTRGIVSGNDPYLTLNSNNAEVTTEDFIDPLASGFTINSLSAGTYIFLAIA